MRCLSPTGGDHILALTRAKSVLSPNSPSANPSVGLRRELGGKEKRGCLAPSFSTFIPVGSPSLQTSCSNNKTHCFAINIIHSSDSALTSGPLSTATI